ncbi:MAG: hypothetical protein NUV74_08830 [Candidatus Brocadiaceae bacterium]|nr:hypothetical protein [Candidatus Brocadiaceae bacterium]
MCCKLRDILIAVGNVGLVRANEEFAKWLRGEITMPIGKNHEHIKHGLVKSPVAWPYSSFHRYVKQGAYDSNRGAGTEIKSDVNVGHE